MRFKRILTATSVVSPQCCLGASTHHPDGGHSWAAGLWLDALRTGERARPDGYSAPFCQKPGGSAAAVGRSPDLQREVDDLPAHAGRPGGPDRRAGVDEDGASPSARSRGPAALIPPSPTEQDGSR